MFFGLLPVSEILLFVGMLASWLYLSIGIISLKQANTEDIHNSLSIDQNQKIIAITNDEPQSDYHVNYHFFSKVHQADVSNAIKLISFSSFCVFKFLKPVGPYSYLIEKPTPGRAPPFPIFLLNEAK
jgi:hypothetical protein